MKPGGLEIDIQLPLDRFDLRVELRALEAITGLFGVSGAGKTSLLESVAGLRRGAHGRIALGDQVWLDSDRGVFLRPELRRLGYVPQDGLLFPHWNVRRNVLAAGHRQTDSARVTQSFDQAVELLELEPLLERSVTALSGGERQRVALGRALCSGPSLLLLDEPLASLDMALRRKLLPFLQRVREELTVPMLLVSHDPIEVQALCDELFVLRAGQVIASGEPRRVLTDPKVFSLALEHGFENVLPATLERHEDGTSVVDLGGVFLVAARAEGELGSQLLVGIPATDIMLAMEKPRGVSARNVLPATVREVRQVGREAWVDVQLDSASESRDAVQPLAVQVATATLEELDLRQGRRLFLLIKATSCRLYGGAHLSEAREV